MTLTVSLPNHKADRFFIYHFSISIFIEMTAQGERSIVTAEDNYHEPLRS